MSDRTKEQEEAAREMAAKVPAGNYGWDAVVEEINRKAGHKRRTEDD